MMIFREIERGRGDRQMKRKTLKRSNSSSNSSSGKIKKMKGAFSSHLTVQLGQVSLFPFYQASSSSNTSRFQNRPDEQHQEDQFPSLGPLDGDIENADDKDCILSQDFFCTPDYITPDGQQLNNYLDGNKENLTCPKSPEKLNTARSKRKREGGFPLNSPHPNFPCHLEVMEFALDSLGSDGLTETTSLIGSEDNCDNVSLSATELASDILGSEELKREPLVIGPEKNKNYVSQSAVALRSRVMPPPCISNPYLKDSSGVDLDSFGNKRSKFAGFFPTAPRGDDISRYRADFHEIEQIGCGNFSRVFKVLKRIDGCMYAVKQSIKQLHQDTDRERALMEVQALAALGSHHNIVGYYTSWFENEQLYIQMELCDCSLSVKKSSQLLTEDEVLDAMHQIATALKFIHERGIAHLDLKPDNIYVKNGVYKLGDFGCATLTDRSLSIEEGDARYMPLEILNDKYEHLDKVDIFSLGATILELVKGSPLPESGPQLLNLREGKIPLLPGHSMQFQNLLRAMVDPDPVRRPSAEELLENPIFDRDRKSARNP